MEEVRGRDECTWALTLHLLLHCNIDNVARIAPSPAVWLLRKQPCATTASANSRPPFTSPVIITNTRHQDLPSRLCRDRQHGGKWMPAHSWSSDAVFSASSVSTCVPTRDRGTSERTEAGKTPARLPAVSCSLWRRGAVPQARSGSAGRLNPSASSRTVSSTSAGEAGRQLSTVPSSSDSRTW